MEIKRETMVRSVTKIPKWISKDLDGNDIVSIQYGGCESGAYMPAVTYHQAKKIMAKYGDEVLDFIEDCIGEIPAPKKGESWAGINCFYLSTAVELWAAQFEVEDY